MNQFFTWLLSGFFSLSTHMLSVLDEKPYLKIPSPVAEGDRLHCLLNTADFVPLMAVAAAAAASLDL